MSKYITVIVTDRSGNPEYNSQVTVYRGAGTLARSNTDRDGRCNLSIDVSDSDRISIGARGNGRSGDLDHIYPEAEVRVVVS